MNELQVKLGTMSPEAQGRLRKLIALAEKVERMDPAVRGRFADFLDLINKLDIAKIMQLIEMITTIMALFAPSPEPSPTPPDVV